MSVRRSELDGRVWLFWGLTVCVPALTGRNPFPLAATLLVVLGVRAAWIGARPGGASWSALLRLAVLFALVGVVFNVLTVPVGDRVIVGIPDGLPIVGRVLTLNALVYGLLSGLALLTLVSVGTTLGAVLDWPALLRLLPGRLSGVATAGSVAFAFVPQTVAAFHEIREAQAARGFRPAGLRGFVPILVPLLAGGMDRALTLAEALESRAFGSAPGDPVRTATWRRPALAIGIAGGATGTYVLATGNPGVAGGCLVASGLLIWLGGREPSGHRSARTRYRAPRWHRADAVVAVLTAMALLSMVITLATDQRGLRYEPYPRLDLPRVDLLLLVGIALLLTPAFCAAPASGHR